MVAKPLPITLTVVAPESLNGVTVPPEPSKALNDLTLAGFDTNGNGVRDDVERFVVVKSQSQTERVNGLTVAAAYQRAVTGALASQQEADAYMITIYCAAGRTHPTMSTGDIQKEILNSSQRISNFKDVTSQYDGRAMNADRDCQ